MWWNDIDRRKLLIRPPELFENPSKQEERAKGIINLAC
jgi:hypothetical protein